jgi:cytosine deaminase
MALHVGQMTSREAMRYCFEAVTTNAAKVMRLEGYGLDVGCNGDLVVLQAADPIEAIRLKARRLFVVRRGRVIAESARAVTNIDLPGRSGVVDFASYAPAP